MSGADEMTSLSDRFLYALRTFDAEAMTELLAADAIAWVNLGNRSRSADEIIATLQLEGTLVRSSTVQVGHQTSTEDGFVVQFVFDGTTHGGTHFSIPICIVARVVDGRIARFDEYADEASTQPLRQELLASASPTSAITS